MFCSPHPDGKHFEQEMRIVADDLHVTSLNGPCNQTPTGSDALNPGARYSGPEVYERLIVEAARHGMKVVVYDARLWSKDDAVRAAALAGYQKLARSATGNPDAEVGDIVAAWDIGDEPNVLYDMCRSGTYNMLPEFAARVARMDRIEAVSGVEAFTVFGPVVDRSVTGTCHDSNSDPAGIAKSAFYKWNEIGLTGAISFNTYLLDDTDERIVEQLEASGFDRNEIFVCTGTHYPYASAQEAADALKRTLKLGTSVTLFPGADPNHPEVQWRPLFANGALTPMGTLFAGVLEAS